MSTETKQSPFNVEEATERVREVVERVQESSRKTALSYLDSFERVVGQLADLEVKAATATKAPAVIELAEAHADWSREVAKTGAEAARKALATEEAPEEPVAA
jgi:histidinol dehydrogenase